MNNSFNLVKNAIRLIKRKNLMKQTRDILKTYFETGDYPTEA
jgi:hypothetical protein